MATGLAPAACGVGRPFFSFCSVEGQKPLYYSAIEECQSPRMEVCGNCCNKSSQSNSANSVDGENKGELCRGARIAEGLLPASNVLEEFWSIANYNRFTGFGVALIL